MLTLIETDSNQEHSTDQVDLSPESSAPLLGSLLAIDSIRSNRRLVYLREWIGSQMPWQRRTSRRVGERMQDAA